MSHLRKRLDLGYVDPDHRRHRALHDVSDRTNALIGTVVEDLQMPDVANTEFAIYHPNHDKTVEEFAIVMQDAPGRLYRSSPEKWTRTVSYFKYDQPGGKITVRLR